MKGQSSGKVRSISHGADEVRRYQQSKIHHLHRLPSGRATPVALFLVSCCLIWHCATQIYPSGGPVDTTPPTIVSTYPEPNTTHFTDNKIILEFSKYVERRSVEESIFISPYVGSDLEFDWSGKEVEITFPQKLKENRTYVVTIGTDVVDVRNRNRMAAAYTLAFSTGDRIDSGAIAGRVFDESPEGLMIMTYRLDGLNPDTLNPAKIQPDYITQTGKAGVYALSHLALGAYRVFAIRDEYHILLYVPQSDAYGVAQGDIVLDAAHPSVSDVNFQLAVQDTVRPQLFSAEAPDRNHITLKFSEPIDTSGIKPDNFKVTDTLVAQPLPIVDVFQDARNKFIVHLLSQDQKGEVAYRITVENVTDSSGNRISSTQNSAIFKANSSPDTTSPQVVLASLTDSTTQIPLDVQLVISFSDVVQPTMIERNLKMKDTMNVEVSGTFVWRGGATVVFIPQQQLNSKMWYRVTLPLSSVVSLFGNRGKDSLYTIRFQTIDAKSFGTIEGRVYDTTAYEKAGIIFVTAENIENSQFRYSVNIPDTGKYMFENVVEGQYALKCFRDRDNNGKYSFGSPYPFIPSERFASYPDTVKVRARWPVEGVNIRFK